MLSSPIDETIREALQKKANMHMKVVGIVVTLRCESTRSSIDLERRLPNVYPHIPIVPPLPPTHSILLSICACLHS